MVGFAKSLSPEDSSCELYPFLSRFRSESQWWLERSWKSSDIDAASSGANVNSLENRHRNGELFIGNMETENTFFRTDRSCNAC